MTGTAPKLAPRPLSPHLQIYRPQITSVMSIFHRMTGIGLSLALPALVWWLAALSRGEEAYRQAMECVQGPIGTLLLLGWSWALCYHFCTGIRHLIWDTGRGLELPQVNRSGYLALLVSTAATLVLWAFLLGYAP